MRAAANVLGYLGLLLVELLVRSLPPEGAARLADLLGRVWFRLDGRRRGRARENLAVAARGGLDVGDPEALVRRTFSMLMRVPVEVLVFPRTLRTARDALRRCRFFGDWRALGEDLARGRGGVFVSGHLGSWELAAWVLRFLDVPTVLVARPLANPFVQRRAVLARGGEERVLAKRGAVAATLAAVRGGAWAGILADQNAGARGVFVPFFGLPASTWPTPALVARRLGVPLYAAAGLRRPGRPFAYDLHLKRIAPAPEGVGDAEAVALLLRSFLEALETWIALAPDQYNWVHRRWRSAPPGEDPLAGRPAYRGAAQGV